MESNLLERARQLAYDDSWKLSPEKAKTVQDMLFYIAELEEKVNLRSFCPYCGKGLTSEN
jgi:hypothetical protein